MKLLFFSLLALENQFGFCLSWKLIFTAFLLFVSTFKQLLIVFIILSVAEHRRAKTLPKDLPKCTAGHETWIMHQASCFRGATSIEIGVCLLKNLARISRCGPSLVQYLAELVISRSFVSYKSRKGTIEFFEKTTPNVHIIDISRFYFLSSIWCWQFQFRIRAVARFFSKEGDCNTLSHPGYLPDWHVEIHAVFC